MIPLSRVFARLNKQDENAVEQETESARNAPHQSSTHDEAPVCSPWNPTGDIFDLRPDLAHTEISELAAALIEMRQLLRSPDDTINRLQLMRFERQYSNALWRRASTENIDTVNINNSYFRLLLTEGMDVVILPVR